MITPFIQYLETEKRYSSHTVLAYKKDIGDFLKFSCVDELVELKELTYQNIRGWIVDLVNTDHSNKTVNRKLSSLRTFFKWAQINELIETNPCLKIKGLKEDKRIPEFVKEEELSPEKMEEIFPNTFSGLRDRLLVEVLYQTGIRLSELIELKQADVTDVSIKVLGKRNKERFIPITSQLYESIVRYKESGEYKEANLPYLFITDNGNKLYPKFVYRKVKYYLSLLTSIEKRSPHVLRHTFATHMLNNGAGLETLKEILGHADLSATQIYTHNSFDQISKIYQQAHPRGGNLKKNEKK